MRWEGRKEKIMISLFILVSTIIFVTIGQPVKLLVLAGAVNGLILPLALALILLAAYKSRTLEDYKHPRWMYLAGIVIIVAMGWMAWVAIEQGVERIF